MSSPIEWHSFWKGFELYICGAWYSLPIILPMLQNFCIWYSVTLRKKTKRKLWNISRIKLISRNSKTFRQKMTNKSPRKVGCYSGQPNEFHTNNRQVQSGRNRRNLLSTSWLVEQNVYQMCCFTYSLFSKYYTHLAFL